MAELPDRLEQLLAGRPGPGATRHQDGAGPPLVLQPDPRAAWLGRTPLTAVARSSRGFRLLLVSATRGPDLDRAGLYGLVWEERYRGAPSDNRLRVALSRLRKHLPAGLELASTPSGGVRLEPPRAVWVLGAAAAGEAAPARVELVGREALLDALGASEARLLTLTGPDGIGRTTLALAALAAAPGRWSRVVSLRGVADVEAAWCALCEALGRSGLADPQARALEALRGRGALLLLDDVDELGDGLAAVVAPLLEAGCTLWCTARSPSGHPDEQVVRVPALGKRAAVALFERRMARGGRAPDPTERPAVRELVDALDRMPLALELAARRAGLLPPAAMLRRKNRLLDLLRDGEGSMAAAWRATWEDLSVDARALLSRTAVLPGGFSLELAEAALAPAGDALDALQEAWDHGLVAERGGRYRLPETLRQFALQRLDDRARWEAALGEALLTAAARWIADLDGPHAAAALVRLQGALPNLLAVHAAAPALRDRAGLPLCSLALLRGNVPHALSRLGESLAVAAPGSPVAERLRCGRAQLLRATGRLDAALAELEGLEGPEVQRTRGMIHTSAGRIEAALAALDYPTTDVLSEARQAEARGVARIRSRDFDGAAADLARSLALYRRLDDARAEGRVAGNLADVYIQAGDFAAGRAQAEAALEAARRSRDGVALAYALANVGLCRQKLGDGGELELREALTHARAIGHTGLVRGIRDLLRPR